MAMASWIPQAVAYNVGGHRISSSLPLPQEVLQEESRLSMHLFLEYLGWDGGVKQLPGILHSLPSYTFWCFLAGSGTLLSLSNISIIFQSWKIGV